MAMMKGGGYIKGKPKKLAKETRSTLCIPRLLVTKQEVSRLSK